MVCLSCDNHDMGKRGLFVAVLVAAIAALVLFLAGWSVRDAVLTGNGDLGKSIATLTSWTGDAGKVALGALIGALGAWIVAWQNRRESRDARFADRKRELAVQAISEAMATVEELIKQTVVRSGPLAPEDPKALPAVRNTVTMRRTLMELDLIANSQEVSDAGSLFADWIDEVVREFGFQSPRDARIIPKERRFAAKPLPPERTKELLERLRGMDGSLGRFGNAVRGDLGRQPLTIGSPPSADLGTTTD
jgi:hypothetical protein